jgi:hypothetical protein
MAASNGRTQPSLRRVTAPLPETRAGNAAVPTSPVIDRESVEATLRSLPSHGWTDGWTGRRDRALLTLEHLAGVSKENIGELTAGDVTVADGVATIRTPGGTTTLVSTVDALICGPCALARWLHTLDMTVLYPSNRVVAAVIARAAPLTSDSPHLCDGRATLTAAAAALPFMTVTEQYGPHSALAGSSPDCSSPDRPSLARETVRASLTRTGSRAIPPQRDTSRLLAAR